MRHALRALPYVIDWAAELAAIVFVTLGFWHYLPRHVAPWAAAAVVVVWGGMFAWGTVLTVQYIARDRRQPDEEGRS